MIEIKNIIFTSCSLNCFRKVLCFFNHLMPLKLKFENESFVALQDGKKAGLITLDKDSNSTTRFKITKFHLEFNSYCVAPQLVNYVISRYRAMGATSFYVVVDEKQADLINIFKNELNFRHCGFEYLYKINYKNSENIIPLKSFQAEHLSDVFKLYNESINSFNQVVFKREKYQFLNNCKKFLLFNDDKIYGYFEIATKNNYDYYVNFVLDFQYNIYLPDALKFIFSKLKHRNKKFNLYVKIKDYFMNSKELLNILNENNMEFVSKSHILAKDYYKEIKQNDLLKQTRIIFNDPTMA